MLPLLLLAGLLTTLDGGSDNNEDGGGTDNPSAGDDTVTGAGDDRVFGLAGDDLLTLSDSAEGLGGAGDDTLTASDDAVGYGLGGNDSLTGSNNATVMGGAGEDTIYAQGSAHGEGGDGNDTLIDGGLGGGEGQVTLQGGAGSDLFVNDWQDDHASVTITDFDPAIDRLGIMLNGRDPADLIIDQRGVQYDEARNVTTFTILERDETLDIEDWSDWSSATFTLAGRHDFDFNDMVVFDNSLNDTLEWDAAALSETISGSAGADSITLNDSQVGLGLGGDDLLIANDDSRAEGGDGNDTLTANFNARADGGNGEDSIRANFDASGYGGDGNDELYASGNPSFVNQPEVYGGNGDDTVGGYGNLHGDDGNDLMRPIREGSLFGEADTYAGPVYGGAGDDTILGDTSVLDVRSGSAFYGGAGNDLIQSYQGGSVDAGAGDDIIITRLYDAEPVGNIRIVSGEVDPNYEPTTLGAGSDVLALDILLTQGQVDEWLSPERSHVIADFNPAEDELALILPTADAGAFTARFVTNAATGFVELRLENDISSMTLLLQGVTEGFSLGEINIYADEAAVIARTPYATL